MSIRKISVRYLYDEASYIANIVLKTRKIIVRPCALKLSTDILDTDASRSKKILILKDKQCHMKFGEIWQMIIGEYPSFHNLPNKNPTGLDVISHHRKIICEIKNRTNTDNTSSRKTKFNLLAEYKKNNPDYTCIYGCINDDTYVDGISKEILHNDVIIHYMSGPAFLKFIFFHDKINYQNVLHNIRCVIDSVI